MNCFSVTDTSVFLVTVFLVALSLQGNPQPTMASPVQPPQRSPSHSSSSSRSRSRSPAHHRRPKWVDPCGLRSMSFAFDPAVAFAGVSAPRHRPLTRLYRLVLSPTRKAKNHAEDVKAQFLRDLHEERLEQGMEDQRQEWLPEIPQATMAEFTRYTNPDQAFKKAFVLMQYFAIGLQQILMDIVLHEGKLLPEFKKLEEGLYQILCEIQLSMHVRGIRADHDILHDAMSHRFRDLKSASRRNLRDYLILREYIKALDFMQQLFAYLKVQEKMSAVNNR